VVRPFTRAGAARDADHYLSPVAARHHDVAGFIVCFKITLSYRVVTLVLCWQLLPRGAFRGYRSTRSSLAHAPRANAIAALVITHAPQRAAHINHRIFNPRSLHLRDFAAMPSTVEHIMYYLSAVC